ncbi:MAG: hypothetical protein KGI69_00385 [Patescibacteria group bacterium]|nr:hypothetical protein [Patescibacteria group bacterium]
MSTLESFLPLLGIAVVFVFFVAMATKGLNPGLPKMGKGKGRKAGGDYIVDSGKRYASRTARKAAKGAFRSLRNLFP